MTLRKYDHEAMVEMYLDCFDYDKVVKFFGCSESTIFNALKEFFKNKGVEQIAQIGERKNYCSSFGCVKELTLLETLCGNKCHAHSTVNKIDPSKFISV